MASGHAIALHLRWQAADGQALRRALTLVVPRYDGVMAPRYDGVILRWSSLKEGVCYSVVLRCHNTRYHSTRRC